MDLAREQSTGVQSKQRCVLVKSVERDVPLAAFQRRQVSRRHTNPLGKLLLRHAPVQALHA